MSKKPKNMSEEHRFSLDQLRENSVKLFGVTKSTFDGATVGMQGKFTVGDINKKIKAWQNKPIKGGK